LLDEGATNISLIYSDLAVFFLAVFTRGLAGARLVFVLGAAAGRGSGVGDTLCLAFLTALNALLLI